MKSQLKIDFQALFLRQGFTWLIDILMNSWAGDKSPINVGVGRTEPIICCRMDQQAPLQGQSTRLFKTNDFVDIFPARSPGPLDI